jgi:hypothetical protein
MAEDRVVVIRHLRLEALDSSWAKTDQMVFQVGVTFFRELRRRLQQLSFAAKTLRLLLAQLIVKCFEFSVIKFLFLN